MKKLNNKGVTLIELIVSFAIVGVAIIYFFQTLYTVKKVYNAARDETQLFVDKDYALRILDAHLDKYGKDSTENFCGNYGIDCENVVKTKPNSRVEVYKYKIIKDGKTFAILHKYFES